MASGDDLNLKIGADSSGLRETLESASRASGNFASGFREDVSQLNSTLRDLNDTLARIATNTDRAAAASERLKFYADWDFLIAAARLAERAVVGLGNLTVDTFELIGSSIKKGSTELLEYLRNLEPIKNWLDRAEIYNSTALKATEQTIGFAGAMDKLNSEMQKFGFENAKRGLVELIDRLKQVPGVTTELANQFESDFAKLPGYSGYLNDALIQILEQFQKLDVSVPELGKKLTAAFQNPAANGEQFIRSFGGINSELLESFRSAQKSGDEYRMQAALIDVLRDKAAQLRDAQAKGAQDLHESYKALGPLGQFLEGAQRSYYDGQRKITQELERRISVLGGEAAAIRNLIPPLEEVRQKATEIAKAYNTPSAQIESTIGQLKTLRAATQEATADAAQMIRGFESFDPVAKWDKNHFRMGFGSDTLTEESGKVREVVAGMTTTVEAAERDLSRRLAELQSGLVSTMGEGWDHISDRAKASVTSIVYNYGIGNKTLISELKTAAMEGDAAVADVIRRRANDNGGINAGRRNREADNIAAKMSVETERHLGEATDIARDRAVQLVTARENGKEIQKQELELAKQAAQGVRDDVEAQKQKIVLLEKQLDTARKAAAEVDKKTGAKPGSSEPAQAEIQAEMHLSNAKSQLRELEISRMRAQAQLEAAGYEAGTKKRYEILSSELAKEAELRAQEPDKLREVEQRKIAVQDEFDKTRARQDQMAADERLQRTLTDLREEADFARQMASMKQLSDDDLRTSLLRNLELRKAAEREYQEEVKKIWGEGAPEFDKAQKRLVQITSREAAERLSIERQANMKSFAEFNSTFQNIYQSISSAMLGVVTRQQTMAQAMRSILQNMSQMVLGELVKKAAAWTAAQAVELTSTTATEAGKTAAVGAGESARTGLTAASSVSQLATRAGSMLKSILSSAAEAFAGVFAFLSPTMGPAAAGPAAASQSAIMAAATGIGMYDVGAWNLPNDQLAFVHKNELIMPATEAGALRNLLSSGGAGAAPQVTINNNAPGVSVRPEFTKEQLIFHVDQRIAANNKRNMEADRRKM
ncbi:MAG: hypothetical protein C3F11_17295 [Methylocystaceae bacterium]|nr:MAG: hypothetical protein C3F11_17295 [Methylocystaceae bacterium]